MARANGTRELKEKPVIFQGTGYRILRNDPRNLELQVYSKDNKKYGFRGYYGTVEDCLATLVKDSALVNEAVLTDLKAYLKEIKATKQKILADIQAVYGSDEKPKEESTVALEDDELFQ